MARNEATKPMATRNGQLSVGIARGSSGWPVTAAAAANTMPVADIMIAVVTAASPVEVGAAMSLAIRSWRSPDRRADRMIQTE